MEGIDGLLESLGNHVIERDPTPRPFTPARMTAGVARILRAFARVGDDLRAVLGPDSIASHALRRRVDALRDCAACDLAGPAAHLGELASDLLEVVGLFEAESDAAARVAVFLGVVVAECAKIGDGCAARAA